jgi:desulfoferrodoxin-like iron-binding protein
MEKRSADRIASNRKINFSFQNEIFAGTVTNMSENGMYINSKTLFPVKSEFDVYIQVREKILSLPVKVRRLFNPSEKFTGMGVELLNSPDQYLDLVRILRWNRKDLKAAQQKIKKYTCNSCNHIAFNQTPTNCPLCNASIDDFIEYPHAIKTLSDFEEIGEFEKKHLPVITVSKEYGFTQDHRCIDVSVKVGEIRHDMDPENRIIFLDYYFDEFNNNRRCIARVNLNCKKMSPESTFRLNSITSGLLTVISHCNAHGTWMAEVRV